MIERNPMMQTVAFLLEKNKELKHSESLNNLDTSHILFIIESSAFALQFAKKHPDLFLEALRLPTTCHYPTLYQNFIKAHQLENDTLQALRIFRKLISVMIIHQMLNLKASFEALADSLSSLADFLIKIALKTVEREIKEAFELTELPQMIILALGKLGGKELNFSSDIDLIFLYDEKISQQFDRLSIYTKVAQKLIQLLDQMTVDGFVYRVDMRLRPFGEGAPLVSSIFAFESYCIKHARDWERYALIKARQITGAPLTEKRINSIIKHFVYRNYIDYTVLDAIRKMKDKILKEMQAEKLKFNIKLGRGGIREIEFIVQCYQLIYGGQNRHLRTSHLSDALKMLAKYHHIDQKTADMLWDCYVFLRHLENALQMLNDQQRHHLPKKEINQKCISRMCSYESFSELLDAYISVSNQVQQAFDRLTAFNQLDILLTKPEAARIQLADQAFKEINESALTERVKQFKTKLDTNTKLSSNAYAIIDELLSLFLTEIGQYPKAEQADLLEKIIELLRSISRRMTYLHLLIESKDALKNLLDTMANGPWFFEKLIQHPQLLALALFPEEEHKKLYLNKADYQRDLSDYLNQIATDDKEGWLEALRRFKAKAVFKVAISEVKRTLTLMETSDVLSALAEALIDVVIDASWLRIKAKISLNNTEYQMLKNSFSVVSYGKLGGFELGFASDLDLIFLYENEKDNQDHAKIYAKVAQQFVTLMQTESYSGKLYTIDLRLRPSGETGFLVSNINAFKTYQFSQAWTWEHQALVRGRFISGSDKLKQQFDLIRYQILSKDRNLAKLKTQICQMRDKMTESLYKPKQGYFHLKYSEGAMVDIEFLAQYMALAYTQKHQEISIFTDNIRIFQSMESIGLLAFDEAQVLIEAYCYYRNLGYVCLFKNAQPIVEINNLKPYDSQVKKIYQKWLS